MCIRDSAQTIRDACDGQRAVCVSLVREKKTEKPPKLYDLTALQREANRVFGLSLIHIFVWSCTRP